MTVAVEGGVVTGLPPFGGTPGAVTGTTVSALSRSGAGDENRTRVISLEDWGSTIELRPRVARMLLGPPCR